MEVPRVAVLLLLLLGGGGVCSPLTTAPGFTSCSAGQPPLRIPACSQVAAKHPLPLKSRTTGRNNRPLPSCPSVLGSHDVPFPRKAVAGIEDLLLTYLTTSWCGGNTTS